MDIFDIIKIPIGYLLQGCYAICHNYAVALLFFTLVMNIVLFPLGIKQQKNMVKQASLRPKEMAIRKKYAGRNDKATQQKVSEEVMKMYQDEHYSMFGGCLPMVFQMVILFALYAVIQNPLRYVNHISNDNVNNINNEIAVLYQKGELETEGTSESIIKRLDAMKTSLDEGKEIKTGLTGIEITNLLKLNGVERFKEYLPEGFTEKDLPNFTLFGGSIDLSLTPNFKQIDWLMLIPVLVFVSYFFSMKLTRKLSYQAPTPQGDAGTSMKIMDVAMPLISVVLSFSVPALLGVYWIYNSIFSVLKQYVLKLIFPFPTFTEEEYKEAEKAMNSGKKIDRAAVKRVEDGGKIASHRIDLMPEEVEEITEEKEEQGEEVKAPAPLKQKGFGKNRKNSKK